MLKTHRINREIFAKKVRLTDTKGIQIGIVDLEKALKKAKELEMDLVEISPNSKPPVCRIMNYGKFIYKKNKSIKKQKKKQKTVQIKEIKFRPNTELGDYKIKIRNLIKFLKDGDKTKITVRFRGREIVHKDIGISMLYRIKNDLNSFGKVEFFSKKIEGRQITMIVAPKIFNRNK
ncbi:translation initiation factor IF-3 [bacterium endosymbiont of Pedicinus badii]|uniref:translation initiation factor IF-3 n=1 Tax=bacterium endosymbiont of Pedicinus badii TaxID=1719126 RepID=UPI00117C63A0